MAADTNSGQYILKDLITQTFSMNLDAEWIDAVLFAPYQSKFFFKLI